MLKYHKLTSFIIGLGFLLVVQKFAAPEPVFRFLVPAFLAYAAVSALYNRWYLRQIQKYNFWILVRKLLLLFSGFGLFLILPNEGLRGIFLVATVVIITFFEIILGNFAENLLLNETLVIAVGLFVSLAGFYQDLPSYGPLYVIGAFVSGGLLARSFYEFVPRPPEAKLIGSLILGLFCGELFWALGFLPLHFSALGLLLFNLFYFALLVNYYFLFNNLNFKKIKFHLLLIVACSAAVVLATPWTVIQ